MGEAEDRADADRDPSPNYIIGLGASAGGLEALEEFFGNMPSDSGLAFVVVQHLSPDYKSLMVELLSKRTDMAVRRAEDATPVERNTVYLIPPKKNLVIHNGKLFLTEQDHSRGINLPIDVFLRSLADDAGEKAVAVILSGTGSDGMRGIRAVKEAGGMVVAQDQESAKFDGMPRSAASTGIVDFILPANEMPEQILRYVQHPYARHDKPRDAVLEDEDGFTRTLSILRQATGVDFSLYKTSTVGRRIERRMSINQITHLPEYVRLLQSDPEEAQTLYRELLIGVTSFFRDAEAWKKLAAEAVPRVFEQAGPERVIRVWAPGCSTGEEAYSVAMLLHEHAQTLGRAYDIKVFATDIDRNAVEFASNGIYPESVVADLPADRMGRFFIRQGEAYQVVRPVRELVIFATHNLIKDPPFTRTHLITCRNLLIYLQPAIQKKVMGLFSFSLKQGGILFLGASESVGDLAESFQPVDAKWKIYACRGGGRPALAETLVLPPVHERLRDTRQAANAAPPSDEKDAERIYQALLEDYVPPAVVVDNQYVIRHVLGEVDDFVRMTPGRATLDLLKLVRPELRTTVGAALHKAAKENEEVCYREIRLASAEGHPAIHLRVKPISGGPASADATFAVFFEPVERSEPAAEAQTYASGEADEQRIADLEQELQYTKENLQATIEELETSNEELQATNEELIASNEELQSTNEELQSVNEELYTVNAEYQVKIQELTDLNHDMDNLLASTDVGTLFLDENLHIRKYTPPVDRYLHILPQDVGRPVEHITHRLAYQSLVEDARRVMEDLTGVDHEIPTAEGDQWILLRLAPYRKDDRPTREGVVCTFIDITRQKATADHLRQESERLRRIMETTPSIVTFVDMDGNIVLANRRAEETFGLSRESITDRTYDHPEWEITDVDGGPFPEERLPFVRVVRTGRPVEDVRHAIVRPDDRRIVLSINASPLLNDREEMEGVVCVLRDVTAEYEDTAPTTVREGEDAPGGAPSNEEGPIRHA